MLNEFSGYRMRRRVLLCKCSGLVAFVALALPGLVHGQSQSPRQYLVVPPLWVETKYAEAEQEYKEDKDKPDYAQRWIKLDLPAETEVLVSTATHRIIDLRLSAAMMDQVKWEFNGNVLVGEVPEDLVSALADAESLPKDMRAGFGPGLPASLNPRLAFSFIGSQASGARSLPTKPRDKSDQLPRPYSPPDPKTTTTPLGEKPPTTRGRSIVANTDTPRNDREFDDQMDYEVIGTIVSNLARVEAQKAQASARKLLPVILGDLGHQLLALDLNNSEFNQLPEEIRIGIERSIENQPERFGYANFDEFARARDSGLRLSLNPEVQVLLPYYMNGGRVSYAMGVKVKP